MSKSQREGSEARHIPLFRFTLAYDVLRSESLFRTRGLVQAQRKKCGITKANVSSGSAILHLKILPYLLKFINKRQVQTIQYQSQLAGLMVM